MLRVNNLIGFGSRRLSTPPVIGALNPSDKHSSITLSNSDKTATKASGGLEWVSVRSVTSHSSGKYYFEWTVDYQTGSYTGGGFANASAALNLYLGASSDSISLITDGSIFKSNSVVGTIGASLANGNIACMAIDLDADLFWARKAAGNWNNSGTADPASGVGGISLPSGMTSGAVFAGISLQVSPNDQGTVNFGASAFTYTVPSGYSAWG